MISRCAALILIATSLAASAIAQEAPTPTNHSVYSTAITQPNLDFLGEFTDLGDAETALRAASTSASFLQSAGTSRNRLDNTITLNYEASPRTETNSWFRVSYGTSQFANCSSADPWPTEEALIACLENIAYSNACEVETEPNGDWGSAFPERENSYWRGYTVTGVNPDINGVCNTPFTSNPAWYIRIIPEASCTDGYLPIGHDFDAMQVICENATEGEITFLDDQLDLDYCVGNPCTIVGEKVEEQTDYEGPFLTFRRTYRSYTSLNGESPGVAGKSWQHNFASYLLFSAGAPDAYIDRSGERHALVQLQPDVYVGQSGERFQIRPDGSGWVVYLASGSRQGYHSNGALLYAELANGQRTVLSYTDSSNPDSATLEAIVGPFGHTLTLSYRQLLDGSTVIDTVTDPAGLPISYQVGENGLLDGVAYQDNTQVNYDYVANDVYGNLLSRITDENGDEFAFFDYDSSGRVILSEHAGGTERMTLEYQADGSVFVRDANNFASIYRFRSQGDAIRVPTSSVGIDAWARTYEDNGRNRLTSHTDGGGVTSTFSYDNFHRISRTDNAGSAGERLMTFEFLNETSDLPTRILSPSVFSGGIKEHVVQYSPNTQLPELVTLRGFEPDGTPIERSYAQTFNAQGQTLSLDGPRTDIADISTYEYHECSTGSECGQLQRVTNASGHTILFNAYNAHGQLTDFTDANGANSIFAHDARGRLTSATVAADGESRTVSYEYENNGNLSAVTLPDGLRISYEYDAAKQLTAIIDNSGNRVDFSYDTRGNRTSEEHRDPTGTLLRETDRTFDFRGQLIRINEANSVTRLSYDAQGNLSLYGDISLSYDDDGNVSNMSVFDLSSETVVAAYDLDFDTNQNLTSVTASNNAYTAYVVDDLGNVLQEVSPDRGTITYAYDAAGNVVSETDARGETVTRTYDAMDRLLTESYSSDPNFDTQRSYDTAPGGIGYLAVMTDRSGSTSVSYNGFGEVAAVTRSVVGDSLTVAENYTTTYERNAGGNIAQITYPSGRIVTYDYDLQGRVSAVSSNYRGVDQIIVSSLDYVPFGGIQSMTYGNGVVDDWQFDLAYRPSGRTIGSIHSLSYSFDSDDNLTQITDNIDANRTQTFTYGLQGELLTEAGSYGSKTYTYDENLNRLTRNFDDGLTVKTQTLTYLPDSNRLATRNGNTATHDSSGNVLFDGVGSKQYQYGADGRLVSVEDAGVLIERYRYDGGGARLLRETIDDTGAVTNRLYEYSDIGQILTEIKLAPSGARVERDIVWLEGAPIAQFRNRYRANGTFRDEQTVFLHSDHLGAPRIGSGPAGTLIWRWASDAFGKGTATSDPDGDGEKVFVKLRLPGQVADSSTGKRYNYRRDYDQGLGRYLQSDPTGIDGGVSTYAYVSASPTRYVDPTGEFRVRARKAFRGMEGADEWMFYFEFTGSCWAERIPSPFKWLRRLNKAAEGLPDGYSGENDVDESLLCDCRNIDPKLETFFRDKGHTPGDLPVGRTSEFNREEARDVLRELKKEFERLVEEECDEEDDCSDLEDAYPWGRLLDYAVERAYPTNPRDLRNF